MKNKGVILQKCEITPIRELDLRRGEKNITLHSSAHSSSCPQHKRK